jgi:L-lactate dehydrogenase complex protein LldG
MGTEAVAGGAREEVLRRIRAALADAPKADEAAIRSEWETLPRNYTRTASLGCEAILELLEDRLRDYDANVVRAEAGEVGAAMAKLLAQRAARRLVVPVGLAEAIGEALPKGFEFVTDRGLTVAELDGFAGVVTASTVAIAETGTIVLQNVPGQGRRAPTLVPDYHLCVVRGGDVVETVPEAMARLSATASLATTFVSGPSATADIEMTRIKGVHGPRFLDVLLIP